MIEKNGRIILDVAYQPQVRTTKDTCRLMLDVIIALIPAIIVGVLQFGLYPLVLLLTGVCSAVFWEWGYRRLFKKEASIGDLSAVLTGLLLALTMPPTAPWWLPVIGTFALAGRAFLFSSYATIMASWSVPNALSGTVDGVSMATPLAGLYGDGLPAYFTAKSMFMGFLPGCIGEISTFAILLGFAYLLWRNVISWRIPLSFVGTVALLTLIFGKTGYSNVEWMLCNIFSGGLMFGAVFMATDYSTSPVTLKGQLVYGAGCGALVVLIRYFGGFPEGVTYAILIMNLCTWAIDKAFHRHQFGVSKADILFKKAEMLAAKEAAKHE